ncbi:MAG: 3-hydroxyacyl-CoA dehydrogenase family protein [Anaerolineae bacterium]|nr:3-hydroxyacyl-CoA dehydrogenase family protein [Anaerolineae bacterium]
MQDFGYSCYMNIAVIGANPLGAGVAHVAALGDHMVALYDLNPLVLKSAQERIIRNLDKGVSLGKHTPEEAAKAKAAILPTTKLENCADADFIIEVGPENLDLKKKLAEKLDSMTPERVIYAVHTESISLTVIASAAKKFPQRVVGMHFFDPVHIIKLVEIVRAEQSTQNTIDQAVLMARTMEKEVVVVRDTPGFLVNRVAQVYTREALNLLGEGHVDAETMDRLMVSLNFRQGPFQWMDTVGVDAHLTQMEQLYEATGKLPRFRPHPLLRKMVQANRLGRKTKQGFHKYDE